MPAAVRLTLIETNLFQTKHPAEGRLAERSLFLKQKSLLSMQTTSSFFLHHHQAAALFPGSVCCPRLFSIIQQNAVSLSLHNVCVFRHLNPPQSHILPAALLFHAFHRAKKTCDPKITGLSGGDKRDRTADLLNAIQALSQLSYTPRLCVPSLDCLIIISAVFRNVNRKTKKFFIRFFTGSFPALTGVFQLEESPVSFQFPQNPTILPQLIANRATKIFVDRSRHCSTKRCIQRLPRLTKPFCRENKASLPNLHPATPGTDQPCPQIACKAVFPAPDFQQCNYPGKGNRPHRICREAALFSVDPCTAGISAILHSLD